MKKVLLLVLFGCSGLVAIFYFLFAQKEVNTDRTTYGRDTAMSRDDGKISIEWNQTLWKHLKLPLDHSYGSHAIVLLATLVASKTGPILELGMGTTSSPLLHRLALEQKRFLLSADSNLQWINYFSFFTKNNTYHQLKYVEIKTEMGIEWALSNLEDYRNWTVVFIDHRPGARRQFDLMSYSYRSQVIVLHDTEKSSLYQYQQALSLYPYKYRFTRLRTYTDVLSLRNENLIKSICHLLESTPDWFFS